VRRAYEADAAPSSGRDVAVPGLARARSQLAVPAMAMGCLVGVLLVESAEALAFEQADEAVLTAIASVMASVIDAEQTRERLADPAPAPPTSSAPDPAGPTTRVRSFPVDGSIFVDGEYLIRGVAGRILASLLRQREAEGRVDFTNREVRLDPTLELPAFRDNFDSRLILLKRRLDERASTLAIEKTGRGRFRLLVTGEVALEVVDDG
jgi:GAF domain-containing protein